MSKKKKYKKVCYLWDFCKRSTFAEVPLIDPPAFHAFPSKGAVRAAWFDACGLDENVDNVSHICICSNHFTAADYNHLNVRQFGGIVRLKPNAYPTRLVPRIKVQILGNMSTTPTYEKPSADCEFQNDHVLIEDVPTDMVDAASDSTYTQKKPFLKLEPSPESSPLNPSVQHSTSPKQLIKCEDVPIDMVDDANESTYTTHEKPFLKLEPSPASGPLNSSVQHSTSIMHLIKYEDVPIDMIDVANDGTYTTQEKPLLELEPSTGTNMNIVSTSCVSSNSTVCQLVPSSTLNPPTPKKRHYGVPRYIGDLAPHHVKTPQLTRATFKFIKDTVNKKNHQIKSLREQNKRYVKKIQKLENLISHLKQRNSVSDGTANSHR